MPRRLDPVGKSIFLGSDLRGDGAQVAAPFSPSPSASGHMRLEYQEGRDGIMFN